MQGYVIGTGVLHLLKIKGHSIWDIMNGANAEEPAEIQMGFRTIPNDATIFPDWDLAKKTVDYIKEHHDTIPSTNNSIIGSMIDGDRIKNVEELKIFKILLYEVTEEDKDEYDYQSEIIEDYCESMIKENI